MEIATTLSVCQSLSAALQSQEVKVTMSVFGYSSIVDELQASVSTVIDVLHNAETKQDLHETQHWIEELKDAMFEADDIFDTIFTQAKARQQQKARSGVRLYDKVRCFISASSPLTVLYRTSQEVKKIKKRLLNAITDNVQFRFKLDSEPIRKKRPEAYAVDIIGREDDLENILRILLHPNVQRDVSYLTIVGIGGLGKTALVKLVFDDVRVTSAFPLRLWTCVSDLYQEAFNIEKILGKILASATGQKVDGSTIDLLQTRLRELISGRKYLLVLDDLLVENRDQWRLLLGFLAGGLRGSWVVVTTRSGETASIVGGDSSTSNYKLDGLSMENSLRLFNRAAFGSEESSSSDDLVEIGQLIVEACARVPLAIRVVGSLLYGQDKDRWLSFHKIGLSTIGGSQDDDITPILKFSYHLLESPLKCCFGYCALFPKDFVIDKKMLISLWIAQGYIVPFDEGQTIEDAAEEYFTILMRRCFFQDAELDMYGEVVSCKIHDLMHDIAKAAAEKDICEINFITDILHKRVHHVSCMRSECAQSSLGKTSIRSLLNFGNWYGAAKIHQSALEEILANCRYLRALDLSEQGIRILPDSIGNLLHLRYLNLTGNRDLEVLPRSIHKLTNLLTLNLSACDRLRLLPKGLSRLIKLMVLEITDCFSLTSMPSGMGRLTCLQTLTDFVLGGDSSLWCYDQLEDLKALQYLKGHLVIRVQLPKNVSYAKEDSRTEGKYLKNKEHLSHISIRFVCRDEEVDGKVEYEEALMEELEPHSNLKGLEVCGYRGMKLPRWATFLQNLIRLHVEDCWKLQYFPYMGDLLHLKVLGLVNLPNLEYIIEDDTALVLKDNPVVCAPAALPFFDSLEQLELHHLPKLKGWWKGVGENHLLSSSSRSTTQFHLLCLSQLKSLTISRCPALTSFPLCPSVKDLSLRDCNERLRILRISVSDLKHLSHCFSRRGNRK